MPLFREVLSFYGVCQGTAKSWRFPCVILSQGDYSLSIALSYSLRRSGVAISTAMAAGLASVSSILMAGKTTCRDWLPAGTISCATNYCFPDRDCRSFRSCRLCGGRVKRLVAPCRIDSSVFPFVGTRRRITDEPLPCARNATVSSLSATAGGAYLRTLYGFSVSERCIRRRSQLVGWFGN
jgi:hypothetical protein